MNFEAFGVLKNTFDAKIDKLYFTFRDSRNPPEIAIENAQLDFDDQTLGFRLYSLHYPLALGDSVLVRMKGSIENQGFEN